MSRHRLDHVERPRLRPEAAAAVEAWLDAEAGLGPDAEARLLSHAREQVAFHLGARPHEVTFTSGATESVTTAVAGVLARTGGGHIVCSTGERPALLAAVRRHADDVTWIEPEPTGWVDDRRLVAEIRADTALVCLALADRRFGVLQPIDRLVADCGDRGVATLVDTAVATGRRRLDEWTARPDVVVVDGHQLSGMPGIGALVVRRGVRLEPLLVGPDGGRSRRAGTPNVPAALALGAAAAALSPDVLGRERRRRDDLHARLARRLRGRGTTVVGVEGNTVGAGVVVAVEDAAARVATAARRDVGVEWLDDGHVRAATGWATTDDDLEAAVDALTAGDVRRLR